MHDLIALSNQLKDIEIAFMQYQRICRDAEYDLNEQLRLMRHHLEFKMEEAEAGLIKETGGK